MVAALLSFIWPGLGQGWVGAGLRAIFFAAPIILLAVAGVLLVLAEGAARVAGLVVQRDIAYALLAINFGVLVYRLAAIADAYRLARVRWPAAGGAQRVIGATLLIVLLVVTVGMHAAIGYVGYDAYSTTAAIFHTADPGTPTPIPTQYSQEPNATPTEVPTPGPTPGPQWAADGRLNILLVGADAGAGRTSLRTDTLELLTIEISTGRAALIGIPRNMFNVPLPDGPAQHFPWCRCYAPRDAGYRDTGWQIINALWRYANEHPKIFPGNDDVRGYQAVQDAMQEMIGLTIDGQLVVTLQGFVKLVDAFGKVTIKVPSAVYDSHYPLVNGSGYKVVSISAGTHHWNGTQLLEYARAREGAFNDYARMRRQQLVLVSLRQQINPCTIIVRIPELLSIAKSALWTNLPIEALPDILELGSRVKSSEIARHLLWPPEIDEYLGTLALMRIHQIAANPYRDLPRSTPVPSGAPSPTTGSSGGC